VSSIVEILLRLGSSLVAWMMIYTHTVWLATLRVIDCEATPSDEFWRLLLALAPLAAGLSFLLKSMDVVPDIARILRWFGAPMVILIPLATLPVFEALRNSTLNSSPICGTDGSAWHAWWAPVQLITLLILALNIFRAWSSTRNLDAPQSD